MAHASTIYQVTIANKGIAIDCRADQTVLQAAVAAGIDYPYACASGNCATCMSELGSGEVDMLPHGDAALSTAQRRDGRVLACCARPRSDLSITWLGRGRR